MGVGRGLGRPWPHSGFWNLIFSSKFLAKNVVILVSREKKEISPFLTTWKNSLLVLPGKNPCDAHGWCYFYQSGSRSQKMTPITLIRRQSRNYGELPRLSTDICDQYSFRSHFVQLNMSRCPDITHYGLYKWEANICFSWDVILTLISRTQEFQIPCILCGHLRFPFISSITKITENNVLLTFRPITEYFPLVLRLQARNVRNCQRHQQQ